MFRLRPSFQRAKCANFETRLEQAHFALGFEIPGYRADFDILCRAILMPSALGGRHLSSRLFQERSARKPWLCYTIFCAGQGPMPDRHAWTSMAGTSGEQLPETCRHHMTEMKRAASDMPREVFARARAADESRL